MKLLEQDKYANLLPGMGAFGNKGILYLRYNCNFFLDSSLVSPLTQFLHLLTICT